MRIFGTAFKVMEFQLIAYWCVRDGILNNLLIIGVSHISMR